MTELHDFFSASVGAAAAFIGLLFVAVTLAPHRVFGTEANPRRRAEATQAFVALGNVFFVSLSALIPGSGLTVILVIAIFSVSQLLYEVRASARIHTLRNVLFGFGAVSLGIYVAEFIIVLRILIYGTGFQGLVWVVFGLYAYALATSWRILRAGELG